MRFYTGVGAKVKRLFMASPIKKQQLVGENLDDGLDDKSKSLDFGSKEDVFLDSRPWLDSDCEDDFYSVNGDFTPSRGSTPSRSMNKAFFIDNFVKPKSETSPTGRKKLSQFLQETLQGEQVSKGQHYIETDENKLNVYDIKIDPPLKSLDGTPYTSGADSVYGSESTPNGYSKKRKGRIGKAMNCCLPSLVHNFSINERRQKTSPGRFIA